MSQMTAHPVLEALYRRGLGTCPPPKTYAKATGQPGEFAWPTSERPSDGDLVGLGGGTTCRERRPANPASGQDLRTGTGSPPAPPPPPGPPVVHGGEPRRCPVCCGRGTVRWSFYPDVLPPSDLSHHVPCRTCGGTGLAYTLSDRPDGGLLPPVVYPFPGAGLGPR